MSKKQKSSARPSRKKKTKQQKEKYEAKYAQYKAITNELRNMITHEKNLLNARTYREFSAGIEADNAIGKEILKIRKKKKQLRSKQFKLYLSTEKEGYRSKQFHWTRAATDTLERKGLSSRIFKEPILPYLYPNYKQQQCGDHIDSIELVPEIFFIGDWFGTPHVAHGLGYNIKEKPDHKNYSVSGRNIDISVSNTSLFEIENPLIRCINIWGTLFVDGVIAPEDDYGMLWIIKEVQLAQYRTEKPIDEIDFWNDEAHCLYRSECGPWYRQYFPETWGATSIGERTSSLNLTIPDVAIGDKFFIAQYVKIETDDATVFIEHSNGTGLLRMPHPRVDFYGY